MEDQLPVEEDSRSRRKLVAEYKKVFTLYLQKVALVSKDNLFKFNKFLLEADKGDTNFAPLGKFHEEMCNFITDRRDRKKLVLIPRSHLKSKLITIGYSLFNIARNPKVRILIYSATWQMAVDLQLSIQKQLKGCKNFNYIYGDLANSATEWSQDRTRLAVNDKREPTITAAGIDNNLVGGHYDLIIMDDVVNRDNIGTMEQIQKVINRYKDSLDLLEPHGQLVVIGTRWHDADLYGWILNSENDVVKNYDVMVKQAYEGNIQTGEGFKPLWDGKFTRNDLLKRLAEEGWSHFSAQYMNNPVPEEDAVFKKNWFSYYEDWDLRGRVMNKFLAIDPAMSLAKEADYTAMSVVGVDEWGQIFILDLVRKKLSPSDLINEIFRMREKWMLNDIGIEMTAFQRTIGYGLREDTRFKRHPFHITELKTNERSKEQRIRALQPLYENGKIFHNKVLQNNIYLEDELMRFPRSTHDDLIDSLSYCLDFIFPARQAKGASTSQRNKYLY